MSATVHSGYIVIPFKNTPMRSTDYTGSGELKSVDFFEHSPISWQEAKIELQPS